MMLSIIIVNYKYKGLIRETLKYFDKHSLNFEYEIHVVDNNSGDDIGKMIYDEFQKVIFHSVEENIGFGRANNVAIKKSKGKYVLLLNPDIITSKESIESLVMFMEKNHHVGIAGPRLINPDSSVQYTCYEFPNVMTPLYRRTFLGKTRKGRENRERYLMLNADHTITQPVHWLQGSVMIVRTSFIDEVGNFDERYFMYMEDVDWCRRFWEKGHPVYYVASSEMVHYHKRASADVNGLSILFNVSLRNHIVSFVRYLLKYRHKNLPDIIDKRRVVT